MPRPSSRKTPEQIAEERIREAAYDKSLQLDLGGLGLEQLPASIGQLSQLQTLSLNSNQLTTLPEVIGQLSQLQTLSLSGNRLTTLPKSLQRLQRLEWLFLHNNPALGLPPEVLGPTWQEMHSSAKPPVKPATILDYYFRLQQAQRPLNEVKLLLVGRGGAGKTSIMPRLRENKFSPHQRETKGITIKPWQLKCGRNLVRVPVWDFAGQIITHATHQFFLTQRSIYILVLTGREDSETADADYWLRLIQAFGTDRRTGETSPVIVALNKCKSHPCRIDRNALREKYPFVVDFIETDCKTNVGITQLERLLIRTVGHMKSVRQKFPAAWWSIKQRLETMKEDYLSYDEYRDLCSQLGESNGSGQDSLATVLHALGVALNYADDARLREATILNPHWVTKGIYTLLREAARDDGTGEMRMSDIARVLPKEQPKMRRYLVELMRRFDLAFPLTEDGERWLVPQRLPDAQPKLASEWQGTELTRLRYRYTALPEGLLPRFITRTYPLSEGQPRWINGVVLEADGARGLVRADPAERLVTVTARGESTARRQLVGLIRADLKRIHDDIKGLNPEEEIELEDRPGVYIPVRTLEVDEQSRKDSFTSTDQGTVPVNHTRELNRMSAPEARDPEQWKAKLFISYSSKDAKQHDELLVRLKPMVSDGLVATWSDRCLVAGQKWDQEIRRELEEADVILLLVSAQFEASDYIQSVEVSHALERAEAGEAIVASVILEKSNWEYSRLAKYQVLPAKGKPVRDTNPQRNAWHAVAEGLRKALEELRKGKRYIPSLRVPRAS